MRQRNMDGIVETVRYAPDGSIAIVRLYQRHGAVWSDLLLFSRNQLVEELNKGKRVAIGSRRINLGGKFETGPEIRHVHGHIVLDPKSAAHDSLPGVPIF